MIAWHHKLLFASRNTRQPGVRLVGHTLPPGGCWWKRGEFHVLCGIGVFVNGPLLFPSLQQHGLSSFSSVCCQLGCSLRYFCQGGRKDWSQQLWLSVGALSARRAPSRCPAVTPAQRGASMAHCFPVGLVIYFCILIHNGTITDLRQ